MHIVFFNHYAGSPYHGMAYRVYYLSKEWLKFGHKVTIVGASYSHVRTKNIFINSKYLRENIDDINYIWLKTNSYSVNGMGRILNMIMFIVGLYRILPLFKRDSPDIVIAASTYPLDNFPAYKLAKLTRAKYIYEVRDLWPLSPIELGGYSKYHPYIMVMQWAEDFAYKHVDKVISVLPCAKQHMIVHGLQESKYYYIPNGIELAEKNNADNLDDEIKKEIPKDKFIVGYTGTFGLGNSLETIFKAAKIIQNSNKKIIFLLVGKGPEKENLLKLKDKMQLYNCIILDSIPKKQIPNMLSFFDICVITMKRQPLFRFGISPNKIFDYMYAGKPIVQAIEAGNDLISDARCGLTVQGENPKVLADAILKLYMMPKEEREILGKNGKDYVIKNHTYDVLARKFLEILENNKQLGSD
jgi:glycosyltransferase involved in cell wall biosynthesis